MILADICSETFWKASLSLFDRNLTSTQQQCDRAGLHCNFPPHRHQAWSMTWTVKPAPEPDKWCCYKFVGFWLYRWHMKTKLYALTCSMSLCHHVWYLIDSPWLTLMNRELETVILKPLPKRHLCATPGAQITQPLNHQMHVTCTVCDKRIFSETAWPLSTWWWWNFHVAKLGSLSLPSYPNLFVTRQRNFNQPLGLQSFWTTKGGGMNAQGTTPTWQFVPFAIFAIQAEASVTGSGYIFLQCLLQDNRCKL